MHLCLHETCISNELQFYLDEHMHTIRFIDIEHYLRELIHEARFLELPTNTRTLDDYNTDNEIDDDESENNNNEEKK